MASLNSQPISTAEAAWQRFGVYRASHQAELLTISTGWPALDHLLPGDGYPVGAVTELLVECPGIGEVSLLLHALSNQLCTHPSRRLAIIDPPPALNAPALIQLGIDCQNVPFIACRNDGERVWCVEQMSTAGEFVAFVVWGDTLDTTALRRLQLAAEKAACPIFVYRHLYRATERSPAALRLAVTAHLVDGYLHQRLKVVKCRGPAGARIDSLMIADGKPWRLPSEQRDLSSGMRASNEQWSEERCDVAGSAFSTLGTR